MEEEIDLRPYIQALLQHWKWIIGAAVLTAIVAFSASSLIPPTYEATALVAIIESSQRVQFDPRFQTVGETQPLNAYPELATSDQLLQDLLTQMNPALEDVNTIEELRKIVKAEAGNDPSLVRLSVQYGDASEAAQVANTWAGLFVLRANVIYSNQSNEQVHFFESQLEQARMELEVAEEALIDFQLHNRTTIISNQLAHYNQVQADYLASRSAATFLLQDVQTLRDQLAEQPANNSITFADQLTALTLQIRAFNTDFSTPSAEVASSNTQTTIPVQLQISSPETLTGANRSEQIAFLDNLKAMLETKLTQIEVRLAELEPQILDLQQQQQQVTTENDRLLRNRDVAQETYTALAHKVEEERITSQDTSSGVRLASEAAAPDRPSDVSSFVLTGSAMIIVSLMALLVIVVRLWWLSQGTSGSTVWRGSNADI